MGYRKTKRTNAGFHTRTVGDWVTTNLFLKEVEKLGYSQLV